MSLEDVFVALTGRHLREEDAPEAAPMKSAPGCRAGSGDRWNLGRDARPPDRRAKDEYSPHVALPPAPRPLPGSRLREFYRQPARLFWVYGFPTVLALGLGPGVPGAGPRERPGRPRPRTPPPTRSRRRCGITTPRPGPEKPARGPAPGRGRGRGEPATPDRQDAPGRGARRLRAGHLPVRPDPARGNRPRAFVDAILQRQAGRVDPIKTEDAIVKEPGSRYIDFLIPGLIGQNTMGGGLWGVGFLLVNFRIGKLLKRFTATPMPRRDFLLAILLARLTFLIPDVAVLLSLGVFVFGMPIQGSLWLMAVIEVVGALAFSGIGLLIASRAQSSETVSGLMNLVMLPMWIFSGLFFSADRFPAAVQPFIQALPLTQLLNALRAVMLEGAGWTSRSS